jgi:2-keto-4-pentenoate hydratase
MQRTMSECGNLLWRLWEAGQVIDALPDDVRPQSRAEGYAVQAAMCAHSAEPPIGWKIAATSAAGQAHINVSGPMVGRLTAERLLAPGAAASLNGNRMRVAEAEFCFRFGDDLGPRDAPYAVDDCLDACAALHVAIEVPDSRYADFTAVGEAQLIADNACAHDFLLGPEATGDWRTVDLAAHPVGVLKNGTETHEGGGSNVLGDPRAALAWAVNEITGPDVGETIRAGQVLTTGVTTIPVPVAPGDTVACDFGILGSVTLSFAD